MFQIIFNELSAAEMAALPKTLQLELLAEFQILPEDLDNLDASRFGVARAFEPHRLARQQQLAVILREHARQNLHERALARPVLAAQRVTAALCDVERDVVESDDAGEAFCYLLEANHCLCDWSDWSDWSE